MQLQTVGEPWMLGIFFIIVVVMIFVDMFLLGRKGDSKVSTKESLIWSLIWISIAMLFNLWLYFYLKDTYNEDIAAQKSLEFLMRHKDTLPIFPIIHYNLTQIAS